MIDLNRLCPGCMRELENIDADQPCPHCGFSMKDDRRNVSCLPVNTVLQGKYLVGKVLGQGGFGITYIGFDANMETRIAIKEFFPIGLVGRNTSEGSDISVVSLSEKSRAVYQEDLEKYVEEARSLMRFSAVPGIVSVKDFFYENGTAYIIMEYIEGITLREYLRRCGGSLSEEKTLEIMRPILEALEKIHAGGITHRDISPHNIMLTFEGKETDSLEERRIVSVKLIDFGSARVTRSDEQKSLTVMLKHGYAPEEQYRSHGDQGPWTDVYSVCATMYGMLTGKVPVDAIDRLERDTLLPVGKLAPSVSRRTAAAVMKGLAVKKENRIADITQLSQMLYGKSRFGSGPGKAVLLLLLLAALAAGGAAYYLTHTGGQPADTETESETESNTVSEAESRSAEETESEPASETVSEKESEIARKPESESASETESEPESETVSETAGEKESKPASETERETEKETGGTESKSAGEIEDKTRREAESETVSEPVSEAESETVSETESEPVSETESETESETAGELVLEQETEQNPGELVLEQETEQNPGELVLEQETEQNPGELVLEQETETENRRERIVVPHAQSSFASARMHAVVRLDDGTVLTMGRNDSFQRDVSDWTDIAAVAAGDDYSAGLRYDGTVIVAGLLEGVDDVARWENIRELAGGPTVLFALTTDGHIQVSTPGDTYAEVLNWEHIKAIASLPTSDVLMALTEDGRILMSALENADTGISGWGNIDRISTNAGWIFGMSDDGDFRYDILYGDIHPNAPYGIDQFHDIAQFYATIYTCYGVTRDGQVEIAYWQDNIPYYPSYQEMQGWSDLVGIAGMGYFGGKYVGLQKDGTILTAMDNLGNSTLEELEYGHDLVWADAIGGELFGEISLLAIDSSGNAYTYGTDNSLGWLGQTFPYELNNARAFDNVMTMHTTGPEAGMFCEGLVYLDRNGNMWMQNDEHQYYATDSGVAQIACSHEIINSYVAELRMDGSVKVYFMREEVPELAEANNWTDVVQVATGKARVGNQPREEFIPDRPRIFGLRKDGTVAYAGDTDGVTETVGTWTDIVSLHPGLYALGAVRSDGTAVFLEDMPEYNYGQYNTADWENLTQLALGAYHTAGLKADGTVYATGRNDTGQCNVEDWTDVVYIAAGESCTLGIRSDGSLLIAGDIGWGTDGE